MSNNDIFSNHVLFVEKLLVDNKLAYVTYRMLHMHTLCVRRITVLPIHPKIKIKNNIFEVRPFMYFDPPTLLRPKHSFDINFTSTKTLHQPLYFSTTTKSRFAIGRSTEFELKRTKWFRPGRSTEKVERCVPNYAICIWPSCLQSTP